VAGHEDLLRRHQPRLRYDSNEAFFADSAAMYTDAAAAILRRARGEDNSPGEVIAEPPPKGDLSLELITHPRYGNGVDEAPGDHLSIRDRDYRRQATELHSRPEYANVVYGRARHDKTEDRRLWLQYWLFYFFNDYQLAGGIGLHEGDWEMVQFRLDGEIPDLAAYCQHRYAEIARWDEVEREGEAPVVYVARGSHASYFSPGLHRTEVWFDIADGKRGAPDLRLEILDEDAHGWPTWKGRWGDTQPRVNPIDTSSPKGPGAHKQWADPAALIAEQTKDRDHSEKAPPAPSVEIRRHHGRLRLEYDLSGLDAWEALPDRLVVTVNSPDEREPPDRRPPETYTFVIDQALSGWILTRRRLDDAKRYDVSVSAVLRTGQPGMGKPTASARLELAAVGVLRRPLTAGVEILAKVVRRAAWALRLDRIATAVKSRSEKGR